VLLEKANDSLVDFWIKSYVVGFVEPSFEECDFTPFLEEDAHGYFACALVIGTVVSDGGDGIALEASLRLLPQFVSEPGGFE